MLNPMKQGLIVLFLLCASLATLLFTGCSQTGNHVLIEAESFADKGGWLVDPQFVEQMGSPYLLAHGLGTPVANAVTTVKFPAPGNYHAWVRTQNWVPGDWDAPGQFKLVVNDAELATKLGTEPGWGWQYAGKVEITGEVVTVGLHDLTGFEGRCDAVYFSTQKKSPPNNMDKLHTWRAQFQEEPASTESFDLVIVGGGIAGCAASIAAAEQGLNVALIHDRPILGGNASSEIRVHTEGIAWHSERILSMINTVHWPNGSPDAKSDDAKRMANMQKYPNIHLYLQWRAYTVDCQDQVIRSVDARHTETGETVRFAAPLFVDCTGDSWIGYWAGAETMYGRESAEQYQEAWDEHGELWAPETDDNRVMGSSVLWRTVMTNGPVSFPAVPWAMDVAKEHAAIAGTWHWEYSDNDLHQIHDAEQIRDHMFRAIYGSYANARKNPDYANLQLKWMSYLVGKRESRRIVGDYIYTFNDVREMREFEDAVIMEQRPVDVHYQQIRMDSSKPDFLSEALFYPVDHYYIPYRCLYSKDIGNLFMAGRCFSCSHIGLGGPRVMHTTGQMGVAVGYAASLCKKHDTTPRGVYEQHVPELVKLVKNN